MPLKVNADLAVQEYGRNIGLKTVSFRAGCITGPNHSGARLHGFLSYLVKMALDKKKYFVYGYKGKQVRDNIHSFDVVSCFWEYFKKPRAGEIYNMGGGRKSNCSILEAFNIIENLTNISTKRKIKKKIELEIIFGIYLVWKNLKIIIQIGSKFTIHRKF